MFDACSEPSPELFNTLLLKKIQKQILYLVICHGLCVGDSDTVTQKSHQKLFAPETPTTCAGVATYTILPEVFAHLS